MTTTPPTDPALDALTRSLISSTQRMLDEAKSIKSPRELGIIPDTRKNGRRAPRSVRHRSIR